MVIMVMTTIIAIRAIIMTMIIIIMIILILLQLLLLLPLMIKAGQVVIESLALVDGFTEKLRLRSGRQSDQESQVE